jgi:arginyl-tRNA synthetase
MKQLLQPVLERCIAQVLTELGGTPSGEVFDLQTTPDPDKGDFALNAALKLAKPLKKPPMVIAESLAVKLRAETDCFREIRVAPPGFVNLFLTDAIIAKTAFSTVSDLTTALRGQKSPPTVVVDYSSVNIAKQMHVGHLRSTIIGDVIARILAARGANVLRQNHLGDWGLPIAMVLWRVQPFMREVEQRGGNLAEELTLPRMEEFYREATKACKEDPQIDKACHEILIALQNRDPQLVADWRTLTRLSMREVYRIYELLGVDLREEHEKGESAYQEMLETTVEAIRASGKLVQSQGANCVFLDEFKTKDGSPLPVIVQKSDGGFNYETFDLAGIRFRTHTLKADRVIYVTDARQALHFAQVFRVGQVCGWTHRDGKDISLEHVAFGSVLGEDNKPLKTRSGENVKLSDLLAEAMERAYAVVREKNPALPEERKREVARAIGIGAVKYADLSQNRNNDYVFAWDRMLALNGNTAPYLQYAHARICSIFRKSEPGDGFSLAQPLISHPTERNLLLKLLRFPEIVEAVEIELRPHLLCNYLFDLAVLFSSFYDQCPVLAAPSQDERQSRLSLCAMVRETLRTGLNLLGIDAPTEM